MVVLFSIFLCCFTGFVFVVNLLHCTVLPTVWVGLMLAAVGKKYRFRTISPESVIRFVKYTARLPSGFRYALRIDTGCGGY